MPEKILVISLPDGLTPLEIRNDWVGLKLTLNETPAEETEHFLVPVPEAVAALMLAGKTRSASYWQVFTGNIMLPKQACKKLDE